MKTIKPRTEVKAQVAYSDPVRTRIKHGIVTAVQTQDLLTVRIGRQPYAVERDGRVFTDRTTYASAHLITGVTGA